MRIRLITTADLLIARYEAARRWERERQIVRELARYGFPLTGRDTVAVRDAERAYNRASALLDGGAAIAYR